MKRVIKYILVGVVICVSLYNSIYIENLTEVKEKHGKSKFDAKGFANTFMTSEAKSLKGIATAVFLDELAKDVTAYCEAQGNKLGISNSYYFVVESDAVVRYIGDENVIVSLIDGKDQNIKIAIDFIFGNAIREGTKMANISDYQNTMDYNNISVELNNYVRENIIPPFKENVKIEDTIHFKGAVKVNVKQVNLDDLRVIPIDVKFKNE